MKNSYFLNTRITPLLTTLLLTLLMNGCSTREDTAATTTPFIDTDQISDTDKITDTNEVAASTEINLSWVAPVEREDNAPISLSEIAGYKVYFSTTPGQYPNSVTIDDGNATGHTFLDFTTDTYYFVVTTIDTEGRESGFSAEAIFTV